MISVKSLGYTFQNLEILSYDLDFWKSTLQHT